MPTPDHLHPRNIVLLPCSISPGGFSHERGFRLTLADGTEYVGCAQDDYCLRATLLPFGPDEPPKGQRISGYLMGTVVTVGSDIIPSDPLVRVHIPDGEVIDVKFDQISHVRRVETRWEPRYLPTPT